MKKLSVARVCVFGIGDEWLLRSKAEDGHASRCRLASDGAEIRSFRLNAVKTDYFCFFLDRISNTTAASRTKPLTTR